MAKRTQKQGFTLVELMVVIMIIGILTAIAIPAVNRAVRAGRQTAMRMEINALEQAVENYMQKYGDYPPDGSDPTVVVRHMRKLFPRIEQTEMNLVQSLVATMDPAEALVFFLGGFSNDELRPITGTGGPLTESSRTGAQLGGYEYNSDRHNGFFDFDPARLSYRRANDDAALVSTDEVGSPDLLPVYQSANRDSAPIVYFDSRTYGDVNNLYRDSEFGSVRPMKTSHDIKPGPYGNGDAGATAAIHAVPFHNPRKFQILSPGLDGDFGAVVGTDNQPVYFITQTGKAVLINLSVNPRTVTIGTSGGYADDATGTMLDNVTNFTASSLEDELE